MFNFIIRFSITEKADSSTIIIKRLGKLFATLGAHLLDLKPGHQALSMINMQTWCFEVAWAAYLCICLWIWLKFQTLVADTAIYLHRRRWIYSSTIFRQWLRTVFEWAYSSSSSLRRRRRKRRLLLRLSRLLGLADANRIFLISAFSIWATKLAFETSEVEIELVLEMADVVWIMVSLVFVANYWISKYIETLRQR